MKLVAVSQRLLRHDAHAEDRDCLDVRWARFLERAGCLAVPIPSGTADPASWLDAVDPAGLVLTGGNDVGGVSGDPLDLRRDALENAAVDWALHLGRPVWGVCRGAQLLAFRFGGALSRVEGHVAVRHELSIDPAARFGRLLHAASPPPGAIVNSYHGWGLRSVPPPLLPVATAADGSVEAFEHESRALFGQMWHPEREPEPREMDLALARSVFG